MNALQHNLTSKSLQIFSYQKKATTTAAPRAFFCFSFFSYAIVFFFYCSFVIFLLLFLCGPRSRNTNTTTKLQSLEESKSNSKFRALSLSFFFACCICRPLSLVQLNLSHNHRTTTYCQACLCVCVGPHLRMFFCFGRASERVSAANAVFFVIVFGLARFDFDLRNVTQCNVKPCGHVILSKL